MDVDASSDAGQTPAASSSAADGTGDATEYLNDQSAAVSRAASVSALDDAPDLTNDDEDDQDDDRDDPNDDYRNEDEEEEEEEVGGEGDDDEDDMGSQALGSQDDDDDEPHSVDEDDLDPINSGAQTPAARLHKSVTAPSINDATGSSGALSTSRPSTPQAGGSALQQTAALIDHVAVVSTAASTSTNTHGLAAAPVAAPPKSKALNFQKKRDTIDIKGQQYQVWDDEIVLEDDPRGETKIDSNGQLLGGREWQLRTFTSGWRKNPDKLYMLSIDVARAAGFRDSLYFFRKFPLVYKCAVGPQEKEGLISQGKLPTMLRSRAVTFMAARNVYKVMGAVFVKDGKYVFDDYYEDKSLAAGHQPGEPAVVKPYDTGGGDSLKSGDTASGASGLRIGSGSGSSIHHGSSVSTHRGGGGVGGATNSDDFMFLGGVSSLWPNPGVTPLAKPWDPISKKARPPAHLNQENWMLEYAKSTRQYNKYLNSATKFYRGPVQLNVGVAPDEVEGTDDDDIEVDVVVEESSANATKDDAMTDGLIEDQTTKLEAEPTRNKRRKIDLNSVKGYYEPITNVAQVSNLTQPSRATVVKLDRDAKIFRDNVGHEIEVDKLGKRQQKLERAAANAGIASIDYVLDHESLSQDPSTILWNFHAGLDSQTKLE
ncbi:chromatin structure-remodeling complex subunit RSC7 [Microbotryomycetes sp. JL221]|nr:chromatin structure-remodeling complex subunit RSC7 [Microbotryomycetes sp. JL221]